MANSGSGEAIDGRGCAIVLAQHIGGVIAALLISFVIVSVLPDGFDHLNNLPAVVCMAVAIAGAVTLIGRAFGQRGSFWLALIGAAGAAVFMYAIQQIFGANYSSGLVGIYAAQGPVLPTFLYRWSNQRKDNQPPNEVKP